MNLSRCLALGTLVLAACSSSESSNASTTKTLSLPLHLTSVKDAAGKDYAVRFSDATASRLYVTLSLTVGSDGKTTSGRATVLDQFAIAHDATVKPSNDSTPESVSFDKDLAPTGRIYRQELLETDSDGITNVNSLVATKGLAALTAGSTVTATGQASIDEGGAAPTVTSVTLTYTVDSPAPIIEEIVGSSFAGPTYLPELAFHVGPSQPVTFDSTPTLTVGGKAPFPLLDPTVSDPAISALAALKEVWMFSADGSLNSAPVDDGAKRTVSFPTGQGWDGSPVAASTIDLQPAQLDPVTSLDLSQPANATPPRLLLTGNARVTADPMCESGNCLVIDVPPGDPATLCAISLAAFDLRTTTGHSHARIRILGQNANDSARVHIGSPSLSLGFDPLKATTSTPGYAFDSGWSDGDLSSGTYAAYVVGCSSNVRFLIQSVTAK
ncbi:MAG: hypothetical protein ABI461_07455 [Polyangiaceae bacterium]